VQEDASLLLACELTSLKLKKAGALAAAGAGGELATLLDEAKVELAAARAKLDELPDGTEPVVPATYHRASAEYFKLRGPAASFYESALSYLGYTPLAMLPADARAELALDVALAALVGDGVYNFGEVNAHPVLGALAGTPHAWLVQLLAAFQTGDIDAFNAVLGANKAAYQAQPALVAAAPVVKEKITLLAIMELAARRPGECRLLAGADCECRCHLQLSPDSLPQWPR
jgi:26S proteasome regulatory subunit N9